MFKSLPVPSGKNYIARLPFHEPGSGQGMVQGLAVAVAMSLCRPISALPMKKTA
jgi:hypothetical protein